MVHPIKAGHVDTDFLIADLPQAAEHVIAFLLRRMYLLAVMVPDIEVDIPDRPHQRQVVECLGRLPEIGCAAFAFQPLEIEFGDDVAVLAASQNRRIEEFQHSHRRTPFPHRNEVLGILIPCNKAFQTIGFEFRDHLQNILSRIVPGQPPAFCRHPMYGRKGFGQRDQANLPPALRPALRRASLGVRRTGQQCEKKGNQS